VTTGDRRSRGEAAEGERKARPAVDALARPEVSCTLTSDPKYLPLVRAVVSEGASLAGFDSEGTQEILLAVTEAVANVIRHAYSNQIDKRIDFELAVDEQRFQLDIIDYGSFVDPSQIASRPLDEVRPGGLGVHLIKKTMDRVDYQKNKHGGTTLRLVKIASPQETSS
jgi:anti-sigma regulatory factor (Ser/Thr protein kinase)